jgi:hypothetical protein
MKLIITTTDIDFMKAALRAELPNIKSSHRAEALARGLGWRTNAAMIAAIAAGPVEVSADDAAFIGYLREHSFDAPPDRLRLSLAKSGVWRSMDREPELSRFGYRASRDRNETFEEADARFQKSRAEMLDDGAAEEFLRAYAFLAKFGRRKTINSKMGSYGLKHDAERSMGDYVANGILIAAALAMGYSAVRTHVGSPNAHFNISSKAA